MNETRNLSMFLLILSFFLCTVLQAIADEPSVEVIDKTNWEKVKGLVPDPLPEWVKEGKFTLTVQGLNYDPVKHFLPFAVESRTNNIGRHELNEENEKKLDENRKSWKPGSSVTWTMRRDGNDRDLAITLAPMPADVLARYVGTHMLEHAQMELAASDEAGDHEHP